MLGLIKKREWFFKIGSGDKKIVVLPRKDGKVVTINEWETLYNQLGESYSIYLIDVPEYICCQLEEKDRSTDEMAEILHEILINKGITDVHCFIGVSLGGMILQKYLLYYSAEELAIFISTIIERNRKLDTVFNEWRNLLVHGDEPNFNISLFSWVAKDILNSNFEKDTDNYFWDKKELIALNAIISHGFNKNEKIKAKNVLILFGLESPLINFDEVRPFSKYFKKMLISPITNAGMRVLEDNPTDSYDILKKFILMGED